MTPAERAEQRARDYVRDRGWRHEPLSREEVAELLAAMAELHEEYFHVDDVATRIAGVAMSRTARLALAKTFDVAVADLTPRAAS